MHADLNGKTAFVTGGAVGIGRGIAFALAEAGADIALTYHGHNGDNVAKQIADLGRQSIAMKLDATNSADVNVVVDQAVKMFDGRIDILINNTGGLLQRTPVSDMPDEQWHAVLDVNLSSAFFCTRRGFYAVGGRIVNISSLAAHHGGGDGAVAYAAAKAGLLGFTRGLAKELGPLV